MNKQTNEFNESIEKAINNLKENQAIAFTDGSFNKTKNKAGYGVILFTKDDRETFDKVFRYSTQSHKEIIKMRNVGAECEAVLFAVKKSIEKHIDELTIYHDYMGISKWISHEWVPNNQYTEKYMDEMIKYMKSIHVNFQKIKSHSGIYYNEISDEIAKNATLKP